MLVVTFCDSIMTWAPFFLFILCCVLQDLITEETPTRYRSYHQLCVHYKPPWRASLGYNYQYTTEPRSSHDDQLSLQCLICSLGMGNIPILNLEGLI